MRRALLLLWALLGVLTSGLGLRAQEAGEGAVASASPHAPGKVIVARLENDPIVDASERYLVARLDTAEAQGLPFLLVIDTPGGAVDTTRSIVGRFLDAKVPVLVLVGPPGSRAASAGMFITLAGHIAAMTPGTNIGAAHPVGVGVGAPAQEEKAEDSKAARSENEVMAEKIENDLVAFAEAIATARGRNVAWAIEAVRNSASVPAARALELGVVDLLVDSERAFLTQVDGRVVTVSGQEITLHTAGAELVESPKSLRERLQIALGDPSVAYTLMSLGVLGIALELYNPGMMLGAVVGGICLVLALSSGLPFSAAGLLLLAAAGVLFVLEVYVTSFGLLSIAGGVCMVLGGIFLFEAPPNLPTGGDWSLKVATGTLAAMGILTAGCALVMAWLVAKAHMAKPMGGEAGLLGEEGHAVGDFSGGRGRVFLHGEYWNAESAAAVRDKDAVKVIEVKGLKVRVVPVGGAPAKVEQTEVHS